MVDSKPVPPPQDAPKNEPGDKTAPKTVSDKSTTALQKASQVSNVQQFNDAITQTQPKKTATDEQVLGDQGANPLTIVDDKANGSGAVTADQAAKMTPEQLASLPDNRLPQGWGDVKSQIPPASWNIMLHR